jgi:hypothetical protein
MTAVESYNAACPDCGKRYTSGAPGVGWVEIKACAPCAERRKNATCKEKLANYRSIGAISKGRRPKY